MVAPATGERQGLRVQPAGRRGEEEEARETCGSTRASRVGGGLVLRDTFWTIGQVVDGLPRVILGVVACG